MLLVFWVNRIGVPVKNFGFILGTLLFLYSLFILWRRAVLFPIKKIAPFILVILLSMVASGWPIFRFGYDWLSYTNDDMANYVLASTRLLYHGFFDIPDARTLVGGRDYTLSYWFFYLSQASARTGVEMILAWVSSVTQLLPVKIFMPTILTFHGMLVSAVAALVYQSKKFYSASLWAALLLGFSPLTTLGTLYQLIAQVFGLAILIGSFVTVSRPFYSVSFSGSFRHAGLVVLMFSALMVTYPEVTPFLGISALIFWAINLLRGSQRIIPLLKTGGLSMLGIVVFLGDYLILFIGFLLAQASVGAASNKTLAAIFPYFLNFAGFARLWGFQILLPLTGEPLLTVSIIAGLSLFLLALLSGFALARRAVLPSIVLIVMTMMGVALLISKNGFGLFKLAMFVQPFLLAVVSLSLLNYVAKKNWSSVMLISLFFLGLPSQFYYTRVSQGILGGAASFNEVPGISQYRILSEFANEIDSKRPEWVILDTANFSLAKLQSLYLRGVASVFPSFNYWNSFVQHTPRYEWLHPSIPKDAFDVQNLWADRYKTASFNMHSDGNAPFSNKFTADTLQPMDFSGEGIFLARTQPRFSLFNRSNPYPDQNLNVSLIPWNQAENHLIYITSRLGILRGAPRTRVSFYQLEPDYYFSNRTFSAIGRYFLFQVVNPTIDARFAVELSVTQKGDGDNKLPPAIVIGDGRIRLPLIGRGSARVFSDAIHPQIIEGRPYLMLDMGVDGTRFVDQMTGGITADPRFIVAFARNISLVSGDFYSSLTPPSNLKDFPSDLENPNLQYSGLYEDGWISEAAFVVLSQFNKTSPLVIRGQVPQISDPAFKTELTVMVDGQEVARKTLGVGDFEFFVKTPTVGIMRRIDLRFSNLQTLPLQDQRPVAALLHFVGFEDAPQFVNDFPSDLVNPNLEYSGIYDDGWVSDHAFALLSQPGEMAQLVVRGLVPQVSDPAFETQLIVLVDGQEVARTLLGPGDFEIRAIPLPGGELRRVELRFSRDQMLPAPDDRSVTALLGFIGFEPAP